MPDRKTDEELRAELTRRQEAQEKRIEAAEERHKEVVAELRKLQRTDADEKLTPRERMSRGFAEAAKAKEAERKGGGDNGD